MGGDSVRHEVDRIGLEVREGGLQRQVGHRDPLGPQGLRMCVTASFLFEAEAGTRVCLASHRFENVTMLNLTSSARAFTTFEASFFARSMRWRSEGGSSFLSSSSSSPSPFLTTVRGLFTAGSLSGGRSVESMLPRYRARTQCTCP